MKTVLSKAPHKRGAADRSQSPVPLLFRVLRGWATIQQRDQPCLHAPKLETSWDRQERRDGARQHGKEIIYLPTRLEQAPETRSTQAGPGLCLPAAPLAIAVQHHQASDRTFSYQRAFYITQETCRGRAWLRPNLKPAWSTATLQLEALEPALMDASAGWTLEGSGEPESP